MAAVNLQARFLVFVVYCVTQATLAVRDLADKLK